MQNDLDIVPSALISSLATAKRLMHRLTRLSVSRLSVLCLSALLGISAAIAQNSEDATTEIEEIIVVGTQIKGADIAGILPITSLSEEDIEITGATSGLELLRSIPQLGQIVFNESEFTGINGARGDIGSINLRGIGTGNTLVLLNGRRMVLHPGTQVENLVPVNTVNSNALPVTGISRLEVLRDGASAVYGTDAVAGVINTITQDNFEGFNVNFRYGVSLGTSLSEFSGTFKFGTDFNDGDSNFSIFGNFLTRSPLPALQRRYSGTEDLRTLFANDPAFMGDTQLNNTSRQAQWGEFRAGSRLAALGDDDDFHIQPSSVGGCEVARLTNGPIDVCADAGATIDNDLRLNRARYRELVGDTDRINLMLFLNHQFKSGLELFSEFTLYSSDYKRQREAAAVLSSGRLMIPASAYYNPLGVDLQIRDYRPLDAGVRNVEVKSTNYRILGGLRGNFGNWEWEAASLFSRAETKDRTNRVSNTLFQEAVSRTNATAYNPFAGGNVSDIHAPSTFNTRTNQATIDGFIVPVSRNSTTELGLIDFKVSNSQLRGTKAGDIGIAFGAEVRRESFEDDRDDRLDGTTTFTDAVSGNTIGSDVMGSSPSPDTSGKRTVGSLFAEMIIPLVQDVPAINRLDVQLAVRGESYSDIKETVVKPKIALSWYPFVGFQVRASVSQGFRAPNLEQINADGIRRVNTGREDWILCHAVSERDNTPIENDDACDNNSIESVRAGGPNLVSEENDNFTLGLVLQPTFISGLTFTMDWWRVEQENVVGLFGDQNQITLDYLRRLSGETNPNVVREDPTADQIALYAAAGLDEAAGDILSVSDPYTNLNPRTFEGIDFAVILDVDTGHGGQFTLKLNAAQLRKAEQQPSPDGQALLDAVADGTITDEVSVAGVEDLIRQNARPKWRYNLSAVWHNEAWNLGLFYNHVGGVRDTSVTGREGAVFNTGAFETFNLAVGRTFQWERGGETTIRFGVNNIGDKEPPIADEFASGYYPSLHSSRGRFAYLSVGHQF